MTQTLKKRKTELLTKDVEKRVAFAMSVFCGDTDPVQVYQQRRTDAKTVMSAFVVGQTVHIAAQRLLSWDCIDNGIPEEDLSEVSRERAEPFIKAAMGGYFALENA